jgi:two-component system sensor histidine kinase SenX3
VVSAHPFRHEDGTGALAVVEDRSDMRRTETVRRDFVANISHELKTPVGALGLLAETIRGEDDPAVMQRLAERMVTESERAARTIDDLLELSRIEFGDDAEFARLDLVGVVGESASRIATAAEQAGVTVQLDVPSDITVEGDRRQLVSAVFNLLDNAVKYTAGGGEVRVRAFRDDTTSTVALSVEDEGIGIPRRSLDRIFERFYRVDRARSRNTGGTGLGLAIVRHVVNNHGGQVVAESVEGQGSVFTLLLPAASDTVPANRLTPLEVHRR